MCFVELTVFMMYVQYKSSYADNKKLVEYLPCYRNDIRQSFSSINYIDKLVKSRKMPFSVIPSRIVVRDDGQAGIQCFKELMIDLDPGFRRGDDFLQDCRYCWVVF
jgi:hypothetical protein